MVWKKLGSGTYSGDTLSSGTFDFGSENIYWQATYKFGSGGDPLLHLNGVDTGSEYSYQRTIDGAADTSQTGQNNLINNATATDVVIYDQGYIFNISDKEKLAIVDSAYSGTTGAGTAPNRRQYSAKWEDTSSAITSIAYVMDTGTFNLGTITVYGGGGTTTPAVNPNLENGTIFITSDTNVHYMWNSSANTWNEVA